MQTNNDHALLGVGAMARSLGKGEETIRDLEKRGVITAIRDSANRRLFTQDQLRRAREHYGIVTAA
jgi:DNA-binding transcriptional MerR regulator